MRKRPFLLVAAGVVAALTVFRTVAAQSPPAGGTLPATTVRAAPPGPYPVAQPVAPGAKPPVGQPARPRLTSPVAASADGVRPAGGFDIPPPNLDMTSLNPGPGGPMLVIPPPTITPENGGMAPPALPPLPIPAAGPTGNPEPRPLVPVPAAPSVPPVGNVPPVPQPLGPVTPVPLPTPTPAAPGVPAVPMFPMGTPSIEPNVPATITPRPTSLAPASLSGKVTQTVTLEAVCPESVVFGTEFRYELIVKNSGNVPVGNVRVEDELPAGSKYIGSDPPAESNADRLSWPVGTLEAGAEKRIVVRVKPVEEGELRSRATVTYAAVVEAKTKVTRPKISVAVTGPEVTKAGEEPVFQIKLTNSGTGPAQKIILQAFLSEGLVHPVGAKLSMEMTNLPPGESAVVPLKVSAGKAGSQWCQVVVSAAGSQDAMAKASVNVLEPLLQITQTGPAKCLVRAEPVYEITLANPGTAATDTVNLFAMLPEGFDYLQATEGATYSATNRAVVWKVSGIAPGGSKVFTLKVRATAESDGAIRTVAQTVPEQAVGIATVGGGAAPARPAGRVLEAKTETAIKAEGVSAVRFEVIDVEDPVEVGKEAMYEVRVTNQGTGACTNVQLVAAIAEGTTYTGSSGPTQVKAQGQHLVFDPIATLGVKGEAVYRLKIRGAAAGETRFRVQLTCDQVRTPIVKEESTRFVKP